MHIEDNLFGEDKPKKISSFGITSKDINAYTVGDVATFKDQSEITVDENGNYSWKSENKFTKKEFESHYEKEFTPLNVYYELIKDGVIENDEMQIN